MIRIRPRSAAWTVPALLLLCAEPARAEKIRNHFDTDSVMRAPGFFDPVVLGAPGPARWLILTDLNPPSAPNRLVQVERARPPDSIAVVLRRNTSFRDGSVSTFIRAGSGREGMILRMRDEKRFLILLVDASGDVALSAYGDGKSRELGRGHAAFARPWEKFSVTASGPELSVFFNDEKLFDARDPEPASGRTGLATTGPGEASFDEFVIDPAEAAPQLTAQP